MAGLEEVKRIFNQHLIGGEVSNETFVEFNRVRFEIAGKYPKYEERMKTKSSVIRMLAEVFIEYPTAVIEMHEKVSDKHD